MKKNIFRTINNKTKTLFKEDILNTLPDIVYNSKQDKFKDKIEWRWRLYNINSREFIEISKKTETGERIYINNDSKWVNRNIPNKFNKYIEKDFYAYFDD
jgi:hypothetical protein